MTTRHTQGVLHWLAPAAGSVGAALFVTSGGWTIGVQAWWAANFLIYVPSTLRWVAAGLLLFASLPRVWTWFRAALQHTWVQYGLERLFAWRWVALPVALPIFWLARERTWYGDAHLKLALLAEVAPQANPYIWKEPLNGLLEYGVVSLMARWAAPPEVGIALLSVAAGAVFLVAIVYLATLIAPPSLTRTWIVLAYLAAGSSQLWFGHIENYSWSTALAVLTLALAYAAQQGRMGLWAVGLAGGAAVSMHPQAVFVLPGLLALLRRGDWLRQVTILTLSGALAPLLTVGVLVWGLGVPLPALGNGFAGDAQLLWTPAQALALSQLAASLQNLWLVAPLWPLWVAGGVWAMWRSPNRALALTGLAAAGMLFYHVAFQNDLPRPRDWSLYAIVGPVITTWGVVAWSRLLPTLSAAHANALRHLLAVGLCFALCHAIAWVGINATHTLLRPHPDERESYLRYRLVDLTTRLNDAVVTSSSPICAEARGCERVALTEFEMPHSGDRRPTIFAHAPARIAIPLTLPDTPVMLWLSPALDPQAWEWGGDGVTWRVSVVTATGEDLLWSEHRTPTQPEQRDWGNALIPLDAYRGQTVTLVLTTDPGPAGDDSADRAGWGLPWLLTGTLDIRPR